MAVNITPSQVSARGSSELMRSPRTWELVKLQGASTAVNDTSTAYTCQVVTAPAVVVGWAGSFSVSGNTVTFTALFALGSNAAYVWVGDAI